MIHVVKGRSVKMHPMSELLSKVTVSSKTPQMFKMLSNYKLPATLIVKKEKK